jgi:UDP-glucose 4-epimerase
MVIPNCVRQAMRGQPITVYGDGTQSRTFTYVSDTVRALIGLIQHPDAVGGTFNIGGEQEISITELAYLVKTMTASASEIRYIPYSEAYEEGFEDMSRRVPDVSRIRGLLDFRPTRGIREILDGVIEYFRRESYV